MLNAQKNVPERRIETGNVNIHAIPRLRTVSHCKPVRLAAIVRVFLVLLLIAVTISFLLGVAGYWGSWGWGHHWRGGHL